MLLRLFTAPAHMAVLLLYSFNIRIGENAPTAFDGYPMTQKGQSVRQLARLFSVRPSAAWLGA